jgi:hypothetical protein
MIQLGPIFMGDITMLHGYIHLADALPVLDINPANAYRFMARGAINVGMIKGAVNTLLSKTTSWRTLGHFITDLFNDSKVLGDEDDIDQALLSICRISEEAITCITDLFKSEENCCHYE